MPQEALTLALGDLAARHPRAECAPQIVRGNRLDAGAAARARERQAHVGLEPAIGEQRADLVQLGARAEHVVGVVGQRHPPIAILAFAFGAAHPQPPAVVVDVRGLDAVQLAVAHADVGVDQHVIAALRGDLGQQRDVFVVVEPAIARLVRLEHGRRERRGIADVQPVTPCQAQRLEQLPDLFANRGVGDAGRAPSIHVALDAFGAERVAVALQAEVLDQARAFGGHDLELGRADALQPLVFGERDERLREREGSNPGNSSLNLDATGDSCGGVSCALLGALTPPPTFRVEAFGVPVRAVFELAELRHARSPPCSIQRSSAQRGNRSRGRGPSPQRTCQGMRATSA